MFPVKRENAWSGVQNPLIGFAYEGALRTKGLCVRRGCKIIDMVGGPLCGGPSAAKPADDEGRKILDSVKKSLLRAAERRSKGEVVLHSYKTQVVAAVRKLHAGTNYFMKVTVSTHKYGDEVFHVRVFAPLPHTGQPAKVKFLGQFKDQGDHLTLDSEIISKNFF